MGIVSYAQNFEDVLLNRVFASLHYAFYVDIGAYNPVDDSVTKSFYDRGWDGINIEPGDIFDQLAAARPRDINLHMAVYDRPGTIDFVQHPGWYAGLSHVAAGGAPDEAAEERADVSIRSVPCDTLANILARHGSGRPIAFLKIDAEGSEEAIIRSTDWRAIRPTMLLIEATKPRSTILDNQHWEPVLNEQGYRRAYFDGINCYYVPDERLDLLRHFEMPVNALDGFQRYDPERATARAQTEASDQRIRELTAELSRTNAERAAGDAQRDELSKQVAALHRELQTSQHGLDEANRHLDALPAVQNAAIAAVVEANSYQLADLRSLASASGQHVAALRDELTEIQNRYAHAMRERDGILGIQGQAARLRHLIRELQWPDGPAAVRAVLPLARLLRRLAGRTAPPTPPEDLILIASDGPAVAATAPSVAAVIEPPIRRSVAKRAARLAYRPFRPFGRPPALRLRAFLTLQLHTEFDQLDAKLERLRGDLSRLPAWQPSPAAAVDDPRIAELQAEIRQFGKLLEDTLLTLAIGNADAGSRD